MLFGISYCFPLIPTCRSHIYPCPFHRAADGPQPLCPWFPGSPRSSLTMLAASFCSPDPHSCHLSQSPALYLLYLAFQPRMPNIFEVLADHTLATEGRQAGRCMLLWVGKFYRLAAPPHGKKINTNYERTCVFRLPVLTACGMSLLPRVAMGQDLFTQVLRKQNPLKESKHYPASIHAGSNWPAVGH